MFQRPEVDHELCRYLASTLPVGKKTIKEIASEPLYRLHKLANSDKLPESYKFLPAGVWEDVMLVELMERNYPPPPPHCEYTQKKMFEAAKAAF